MLAMSRRDMTPLHYLLGNSEGADAKEYSLEEKKKTPGILNSKRGLIPGLFSRLIESIHFPEVLDK